MSDIADRVKKIVVENLGVDAGDVNEAASFIDDLGADSLDTVELVMAFEEEFGIEIPDDAAETILTVADAVKFIEQACSMNFTASATVRMVSAASSGISIPNSSSKAITSSTVSRLSAPRSSIKLAASFTSPASTPRFSTTIFFTRSAISLMTSSFKIWAVP